MGRVLQKHQKNKNEPHRELPKGVSLCIIMRYLCMQKDMVALKSARALWKEGLAPG